MSVQFPEIYKRRSGISFKKGKQLIKSPVHYRLHFNISSHCSFHGDILPSLLTVEEGLMEETWCAASSTAAETSLVSRMSSSLF